MRKALFLSLGLGALTQVTALAQDAAAILDATAADASAKLAPAADATKAAAAAVPADLGLGWVLLPPIASVIGLLMAFMFYKKVLTYDEGTDTMKEIAEAVRVGARAYLRRQFTTVAYVVGILFVIFAILAFMGLQSPLVPVAFVTGAFFSALTGILGMATATRASARTACGAQKSLNDGLQVAFRAGSVMGLMVVGFGLLAIWCWFMVLDKIVYTPEHLQSGFLFIKAGAIQPGDRLAEITNALLGFSMGASLCALFARVGGGIYTKSADVGADLVGKVEAGIPEDDPRNPATIADNVGDNVGDVCGMGADLYESYCSSILSTAALGAVLPAVTGYSPSLAVFAPMIVAGAGIVLSVIAIFTVRCGEDTSMKALLAALNRGVWVATGLIIIAAAVLAQLKILTWPLFAAISAGLIAGAFIGWVTGIFTSDDHHWTRGIAEQGKTGPATVIIAGLGVGMISSSWPVIATCIGILVAFGACAAGLVGEAAMIMGLYGIAFAAVGMLATLGITLATDAYGPIADNAGGNAEMSGLPHEVREKTDALDMLGNSTAAMGKGFAIASAGLTALALLAAYLMGVDFWAAKMGVANARGDITIMNPLLICGMFIGGMVVLVFSALTMRAVGRAAGAMVEEVRRQFREIPGIMERKNKPDYSRCVEISTQAAQREMILPSLLAVAIPVATGCILGTPGILGLLAGSLATGFSIACMLNNAGGAWDNAKKYVEKGNLGGKKSDVHKACVVGDTVGDPCKDTSGPSLNILLKLMAIVAIIFTPFFVKVAPVIQGWLHLN